MIWGCFGATAVGDLHRVQGIGNQHGYRSILQQHAIPSGKRLIGANSGIQQDNDPKHASKFQQMIPGEEGVRWSTVYDGLATTVSIHADLNPIELLWEQLDRKVREKCPTSTSHLQELLQKASGEISSTYLEKLTARMPRICKAVIAAIGGFFDESKI